jgi:hypothetical protein
MENLLPTEGPGRDDLERLYLWSFEEAEEAQEKWYTEHGPEIKGHGPLDRWIGAQELKDLHCVYQKGGEQSIILDALFLCSLHSLPIPQWCQMAYLESYRKVKHYKAKSWDDVFGKPHKKGVHLAAKKDEREKSLLVYYAIKQIKQNESSTRTDKALFERVGAEYGICATLAEEFYYKWKNRLKKKQN